MNNLTIFGVLGQNAVIGKPTANGSLPISFSVAVSEKRGQQDHTDWFSCTKWVQAGGSTAIAQYLTKGTKVCISGRVSARSYTDRDSQPRASLEVNVTSITLAGSAQQAPQHTEPIAPAAKASSPAQTNDSATDDVPF